MCFNIYHFYIVCDQFAIFMKKVIKHDFGITLDFSLLSSDPLIVFDI